MAEHEVPEPLSEEDFVRTSLKSPPRRQPANYRQWSSSRNEHDRYDDATTLIHTTRRARTKPDVDRLIESELNRMKRCNRCGNLSSKKNEPPLKNSCRFDDCANIPIKGPIGKILYLTLLFDIVSLYFGILGIVFCISLYRVMEYMDHTESFCAFIRNFKVKNCMGKYLTGEIFFCRIYTSQIIFSKI